MSEYGEESPSLLDPETLEALLRQLEATDIDELEFVQAGARVYLRREPGHRTAYIRATPGDSESADGLHAIVAPLSGMFYGRPSPEQAPFASEGDTIEPGQVVGLIETMKLFNEVTAELWGEVTRIAVADGEMVELGQVLVFVRPLDPAETE
jgi:acetyl-CoA carboxylase biotin carboxyl carrier protein